jgi:hypothetical protein
MSSISKQKQLQVQPNEHLFNKHLSNKNKTWHDYSITNQATNLPLPVFLLLPFPFHIH